MASRRADRSGSTCRRIGHSRLIKGVCTRCRMEFSRMPRPDQKLSIADAYKKGYVTLEDQIRMLSGLLRREKPPYDRHPKRDNHHKLCRRICEAEILPAKIRYTNWVKDQVENHGLQQVHVTWNPDSLANDEQKCEALIEANAAIFFGETTPMPADF